MKIPHLTHGSSSPEPATARLLEQEAGTESEPGKTQEQRKKELEAADKTIEFSVRELRRHQVLLTLVKQAEGCEAQGR